MTSKTKVEVTLCTDEDIPTVFAAISESFGDDAPFVGAYFPKHKTEAGRAQGTARFLDWKRTSKESYFLKAVVSGGHLQQEQIAGAAVWTHMTEPPSPELEKLEEVNEVWPDKDDREFMALLYKEYLKPRCEAVKNAGAAGVWVLEFLGVHPDHQRMGAGSALVKWGTNAAEKDGIDAVVEGTAVGRKTYENRGFVAEIEQMTFDFGDKFADRKKPALVFMRKPGKQ